MRKRRYSLKDKNGSATILDAIIAIGIAVAFFMVFINYTNALYTIQDEPGVDLELKSVGLMETLINSPGQSNILYPEWQEEEDEIDIIKSLGLGTSRTIKYGTLKLVDKNVTNILSLYPKSNSIGIENTCFLSGTQIVMADESYKNIEDIKVGDFVKSYDENSNRIEDKQVTHIFHHTPDEMGDYYFVINNQLRVTPNHRFYIDGDWIFAEELRIGNNLFYPSTDYAVFSIEKIFERTYTYNFEVEGHHNYFVAMDTTDVLVHNAQLDFTAEAIPPIASAPYTIIFRCNVKETIPNFPYRYLLDFGDGSEITEVITSVNPVDIPHPYTEVGNYDISIKVTNNIDEKGWFNISDLTILPGPVADFTWFDKDGPFYSGTTILCNASISTYSGSSATFQWYKDGIYATSGKIVNINLGDNKKHIIKLKLTDIYGNSNSRTLGAQANVLPTPKIDSKPWVLTGKEIYPDIDSNTFQSYLNDYYVKYTPLEEKGDVKYLLFEVKEKTNTEQPIIDFNKIKNLAGSYNRYDKYNDIKSALGLDSKQADYNFCINIKIYNENGAFEEELYFGATDDNNFAKASTTRQVLVYEPPTAKLGIGGDDENMRNYIIDLHPKYKRAEVTISIFLGGTPPID